MVIENLINGSFNDRDYISFATQFEIRHTSQHSQNVFVTAGMSLKPDVVVYSEETDFPILCSNGSHKLEYFSNSMLMFTIFLRRTT